MGFVFLFKVPLAPCQPGDAEPKGAFLPSKLGVRVPRPSPVAASRRGIGPLESLWGFTPVTCRNATGEPGDTGLAEAGSAATPFQRRGGNPPCRAPDTARGRSRAW